MDPLYLHFDHIRRVGVECNAVRSAFDDVLALKSQLWQRISMQGAGDTSLQHEGGV